MAIKPESSKFMLQSLTSKKFVTVIYSLTWLFAILLIVILRPNTSESIVNALLMAVGGVFTAFVGANTFGDHYFDGKYKNDKDPTNVSANDTTKKV